MEESEVSIGRLVRLGYRSCEAGDQTITFRGQIRSELPSVDSIRAIGSVKEGGGELLEYDGG